MGMQLLKKKNYLTMIQNAVRGENNMFRNVFANIDGEETDIANDGFLSCALFVSSLLFLQKLALDIHATVDGTEKDMLQSGWEETDNPTEGSILIWEPKIGKDGKEHRHIGFYVGDNMAVSNASNSTGIPRRHHYTYDDTRKIVKIYRHPILDEE
jgi:hypothetical protein